MAERLTALVRFAGGLEKSSGEATHKRANPAIFVILRGEWYLGRGEGLVTAAKTSSAAQVAGDVAGVSFSIDGPQAEMEPAVDHPIRLTLLDSKAPDSTA